MLVYILVIVDIYVVICYQNKVIEKDKNEKSMIKSISLLENMLIWIRCDFMFIYVRIYICNDINVYVFI